MPNPFKKLLPTKIPGEVKKMLKRFREASVTLDLEENLEDRPIYSTTLYLASCKVEMTYGEYRAHVFQDIVHKGYIIALAYGNVVKAKALHVRVHSSCVTSETLRGCDCDCVQQLEGALKCIAKKEAGILFYLMQEGRGVGYIAKARDRMLVQSTNDAISTFEAYKLMGLRRDYRQYRNIKPICELLKIKAPFILLTNNPTKVAVIEEGGIKLLRTEPLEFEPSPYNLAYLKSKEEMGHILDKTLDTNIESVRSPEPVVPFKPHAVPSAQRFIYAASYFLPVKPVESEVILTEEQFSHYFEACPIDGLIESATPLLLSYSLLRNQRYKIKLHKANLKAYRDRHPEDPLCKLLHLPYWFRVHVYFDLVSGEDFVVLTYGRLQKQDIPVVRLYSESLFNRFPITDTDNKDKYKATLQEIMRYGSGVIILLYNDGRGSGLGAYAIDQMFEEKGVSGSTEESYEKLGVNYDRRDYEAAITLLKIHLSSNKVQMVMNSPSSMVKKTDYTAALNKLNIEVVNWIFLEEGKQGV